MMFLNITIFIPKIKDKNDNPEPIIRIIASSKEIYDDLNSCYAAADKLIKEYKDQKEINDNFIVSTQMKMNIVFKLVLVVLAFLLFKILF